MSLWGQNCYTTFIDLSEQGFSNGQQLDGVEINVNQNIRLFFHKGTGSNEPKYYDTGSAVRCYGGNYFTVTTSSGVINSITLTFSSGEGTNAITTDVGNYEEPWWTGDNDSVNFTFGGTSGHRRIKALEITYCAIGNSISVTANPTEGGVVMGTGIYDYGTTCTLTAASNAGYNFTNWTKDGEIVSVDLIYNFIVTESGNYFANFSLDTYTIAVMTNPEIGGSVTGDGDYNYGQNCTLTATANDGYTFLYWTENNEVVSTESTYSFIVTGSKNLVANYALPFTISATANPTNGGTVSGGGAYDYGVTCTMIAIANEGFTFMYWSESGEIVSTETNYSFIVIGDRNLEAIFALPFTISVTANLEEGGTVNGGGAYDYGTICTVTATANAGYTFMYWTENNEIVSNDAIYSFSVTGERALLAHFSQPFTISVVADLFEGGTVYGAGVINYGETCYLSATPNVGYNFVNWTKDGEEVSTNQNYNFMVTEAGEYVAHFSLSSFIIRAWSNPEEGGSVSFE